MVALWISPSISRWRLILIPSRNLNMQSLLSLIATRCGLVKLFLFSFLLLNFGNFAFPRKKFKYAVSKHLKEC